MLSHASNIPSLSIQGLFRLSWGLPLYLLTWIGQSSSRNKQGKPSLGIVLGFRDTQSPGHLVLSSLGVRKCCLQVQSGFFNSRGIVLGRPPQTQSQLPKAVFMDLCNNEHLQSGKAHLGLATKILSLSYSGKEYFYFEYLMTFAEIGLICKLEHFKNFFIDCSGCEVPVFLGLLQRALKLIGQAVVSLLFSCRA